MRESKTLFLALLIAAPVVVLMAIITTTRYSPVQAQGMFIHFVAPGGNCGGASPCYATIQAAVNDSANGDIIKVAQGVYTGTTSSVVYIDRAVSLTGGYTTTDWVNSYPITRPTVIDGQNTRRGMYIYGIGITGVPTITLQGLVIQRGYVQSDDGGGVRIRSGAVVLRESRVLNNMASNVGGGVYLNGGTITLDNNIISGNRSGRGGGVHVIDGTITLSSNTIQSNTASYGGGVYVSTGTVILNDNSLLSNRDSYGGGTYASGMYVSGGTVTLNGNTIRDNLGRGIYLNSGTVTLSGNTIQSNSGDGVYMSSGTINAQNDIIAGNGEGVSLSGGNLTARHWTLADNDRYAVFNNSGSAVLTNTVVYHHIMAAFYGPNILADHTLFYRNGASVCQNGATCTNDMIGDPEFVNPAAGDYHIGSGSAAIDVGVDAGVTTDIDGGPRPVGAGYDIGADEYGAELPPLTVGPRYDPNIDVNKDGKINILDIMMVVKLWGTSQ
jgi:parallel beta-helix repeat protein